MYESSRNRITGPRLPATATRATPLKRAVDELRWLSVVVINRSELTPSAAADTPGTVALIMVALYGIGRPYIFLANVNSRSRSLYAIARPSVCRLSVTFVRPTQAVQIFGNISMALGT